jgi:hypothetical protein
MGDAANGSTLLMSRENTSTSTFQVVTRMKTSINDQNGTKKFNLGLKS